MTSAAGPSKQSFLQADSNPPLRPPCVHWCPRTGLGSGRSARRAAGAGCDNAASASRGAWPLAIRRRRQGQGHRDRTWPQDVSVPPDGATVFLRKDSRPMCPLVALPRHRCRFAGRSLPGSCGNRRQRCAWPRGSTGASTPARVCQRSRASWTAPHWLPKASADSRHGNHALAGPRTLRIAA